MANYNYFRKTEADSLKKIQVSFLKKHDYLSYSKSGTIVWSNNYDDNKSTIGVVSYIPDKGPDHIRLWYSQTDQDTGEKKEFDYGIPLTSTPCNYGGYRHWFVCPCPKNGNSCGRRVGVLYKNGDYFACRHCYSLTYASRNLSGIAKQYGSVSDIEVNRAREAVKRMWYRGNYTKKFRRYVDLENKLDGAITGMFRYLAR